MPSTTEKEENADRDHQEDTEVVPYHLTQDHDHRIATKDADLAHDHLLVIRTLDPIAEDVLDHLLVTPIIDHDHLMGEKDSEVVVIHTLGLLYGGGGGRLW